jgi:lipoprotein NlpI
MAIRLDGKNAAAYNNRGSAWRSRGDHDRAITDFGEAIKLESDGTYFFNRGNAYRAKGDNARAIADYNEAIRLDPKDAAALNNRGNAYRDSGDGDRAMVDYDEMIRVGPTASRFHARGEAHRLRGDYARAIADFSESISREPKAAKAYFDRGLANLYGGALAKAQSDFVQANELVPQLAYAALWREIAERRNNAPTSLAQTASRLDPKAWPAPIVRLFLGVITPEAAIAAAADPDSYKKGVQLCEARFYAGELSLLQGAKAEAVRLFRQVSSECRHTVVEWTAANAELKAVEVSP